MAKTYQIKASKTSYTKSTTSSGSKPSTTNTTTSDIGKNVVAGIARQKIAPILDADGFFDGFDLVGDINKDFSKLDGALNLSAGAGNDSVVATNFNDTLEGGNGADTLAGGAGHDRISLGNTTGNDNAGNLAFGDGVGQYAFVKANLTLAANVIPTLSDALARRLGFYRQAALEAEKDPVTANALGDDQGGKDWIRGGSGNDTEFGGGGDDTLLGGDGDDVLLGGQGSDKLLGGNGNDIILGGGNLGALARAARDTINGNDGNDVISAFAGEAYGDAGNDTIISEGSGSLYIDGGAGDDSIVGSGSAETIVSGSGRDTINAGDGDDLIILDTLPSQGSVIDGGLGFDTLRIRVTSAEDDNSLSQAFNNRGSANEFTWKGVKFQGIQKLEIDADYTPPTDGGGGGGSGNPNDGNEEYTAYANLGGAINAGKGDDTVKIVNLGMPNGGSSITTWVDGGDGTDKLVIVVDNIAQERYYLSYFRGLQIFERFNTPLEFQVGNLDFKNFEFATIQRSSNFNVPGQSLTLNDANGVNSGASNVVGSLVPSMQASADTYFAGNDTVTVGDNGYGKIMMLEGDDLLIMPGYKSGVTADGGDGYDRLLVRVWTSYQRDEYQKAFNNRDSSGRFTINGNTFSGFEELNFENVAAGESISLNGYGDIGPYFNVSTWSYSDHLRGNDTVTVGDNGRGFINAWEGDDQVIVKNNVSNLSADGGDGFDTLAVDAGSQVAETQWRDAWVAQAAQHGGSTSSFIYRNNTFKNFEQLGFLNTTYDRNDFFTYNGGGDRYTYTGNDDVNIALQAKGKLFLGYDDDIARIDFNTSGMTVDGGDGFDKLVYKVYSNAQKKLVQDAFDARDANGNFTVGKNTFRSIEALDFDTSSILTYQTAPTSGDDTVTAGAGLPWDPSINYQDLLNGNDLFDATKATADKHFNVFGNDGNDTIKIGAGASSVDGGNGDDTIIGGAGNDVIYSWSGRDVIDGGSGDDWIRVGGTSNVSVYGGYGNDYIDLWQNSGKSTASGGFGNDFIVASQYLAVVLNGDGGRDTLFGQNGDDTINGGSDDDDIYGNGELYARNFGNVINNGTDKNVLDGGDGNDRMFGANGADTMSGGRGNDTLVGFDGDDVLVGGSGTDSLSAGAGDDRFYMSGDRFSDGTLQIGFNAARKDASSHGFSNQNSNAKNWDFSAKIASEFVISDDYYDGGEGNNDMFVALGSNDYVRAINSNGDVLIRNVENFFLRAGDDIIDLAGYSNNSVGVWAGDGHDLIIGSDSGASLFGEADNDTIASGSGDDYINGGSGNDLILAGVGRDTLIGGSGADTFVFTPRSGQTSYIWDFNEQEGDKIVMLGQAVQGNMMRVDQLMINGKTESFFHYYGTVKDSAGVNTAFDMYIRKDGYVGPKGSTGAGGAVPTFDTTNIFKTSI